MREVFFPPKRAKIKEAQLWRDSSSSSSFFSLLFFLFVNNKKFYVSHAENAANAVLSILNLVSLSDGRFRASDFGLGQAIGVAAAEVGREHMESKTKKIRKITSVLEQGGKLFSLFHAWFPDVL